MKAIATPTEPKGVEPGLFPRASRPVAGFGFEQLFTITTPVVSDEAIAIETALPPELVPNAQALPMIGLVPIDAAQMPPGLGIFGADMEQALMGSDDGALPVPVAAVTEGAGPKADDDMVPAPPFGAIAPLATATGADAGLAVPQAAPILQQALGLGLAISSETAPGAGPTHPASSGPDLAQTQPEGLPPLALQPKLDLRLDAAKTLPAPTGETMAQDDLAPLREAVAPRIMPEHLARMAQPKPDLPLDTAKTSPAPLGEAVAPRIMPEHLARMAQPKTALRDPKADGTVPATAAKSSLTPVLALGDSGAIPIDPTPTNTVPSAAKPAQMAIPPVAMQLAKASPRGDQPDAKILPKSMLAAAARGDALRQDMPQCLPQQAEAQAIHGPTARAPVTVPTPAPALPMPLPMAGMLNLRQSDWSQQLVGQIERMVTSGTQRIELSLRPKNLGEIQVSLDLRGDQTQVHIVTETAAAARLLVGAEDRLAQMLDQSGYRLSGFSAQDHGTGGQQGQTSGQQGQQGQHAPRRNRTAMDTTLRDEPKDAIAAGPNSVDRGRAPGINMLA